MRRTICTTLDYFLYVREEQTHETGNPLFSRKGCDDMRSQKVLVPVRLLSEDICLTCKDLCIEDKMIQMFADDRVWYQHSFSCENINRCERISNDVEKMLKEKAKNVESASREDYPDNGSELSEI